MKLIIANIKNDEVIVNPGTPPPDGLVLNLKPAHKNWQLLREKGWIATHLIGEPKEQGVEWHFPENDRDRLELEIATYDYYYQMSDDGRVYSAGRAQDRKIQGLAQKVGQDVYKELWNAYAEFRGFKELVK